MFLSDNRRALPPVALTPPSSVPATPLLLRSARTSPRFALQLRLPEYLRGGNSEAVRILRSLLRIVCLKAEDDAGAVVNERATSRSFPKKKAHRRVKPAKGVRLTSWTRAMNLLASRLIALRRGSMTCLSASSTRRGRDDLRTGRFLLVWTSPPPQKKRHESVGRHYAVVLSPWDINKRCALTLIAC